MDDVLKTRIQGSSSIDFSFVASGKTQGHIIFSKNLWELKPGFLLVEEAGGIVHQYDGEAFNFEGKGYIVASNKTILKGILKNLELLK
jgi:myo-inositol-1(or 4)-monophosphatase